jgi:hypothetical protein
MNVHGGTIKRLAAVVVAGVLLASCSSEPKEATRVPSSAAPVTLEGGMSGGAASAAPSATPTYKSSYNIKVLVGNAPAKLPVWTGEVYSRSAAEDYSVQTLLFLRAAMEKSGLGAPPLSYAFYDVSKHLGKPGCNESSVELESSMRVCTWESGKPAGILVDLDAWGASNPWRTTLRGSGEDPLHNFVSMVAYLKNATYPDVSTGAWLRRGACIESQVYKGIVLMQPELGPQVGAYLNPAKAYNPAPDREWRYEFYLNGCSDLLPK